MFRYYRKNIKSKKSYHLTFEKKKSFLTKSEICKKKNFFYFRSPPPGQKMGKKYSTGFLPGEDIMLLKYFLPVFFYKASENKDLKLQKWVKNIFFGIIYPNLKKKYIDYIYK